ncbi:MAG TPA: stage II sporulation protein M [Candidatus Bathyarchaeia archaeon]|nr:stage II sporulation protein M [Candidatus Bathyarchaeia archaeon]
MISTSWLQKRRPYWARIDELLTRAGRTGVRNLTHPELQELALLYRQTASDLATIREDASSRSLAHYLNQLLGRAHNFIYMGRKSRPAGIVRFYRETFPQVFHDTFGYTFTAGAIFWVLAAAGATLAIINPGFQRYLLGADMMETIERRQMWTHSIVTIKPLASSAIMTNNLSVSFTTFALGITAGVGTVFELMFNGLLIGVVGAACWEAGMSLQLWSFVAPHGVIELPAIFIAGGGGLLIAKGLLFPGTLPRRASLVREGGRAVRLVLGIIPMLIVAGTIEGFVSPSELPGPLKFGVAAGMFLLLLLFVKRKTPKQSPEIPPVEAATSTLAVP